MGVVVFAAATLPYVSTWSDAFIADDWAHLLHSKNLTLPVFLHNCSFTTDDLYYRPVAIAYFYVNYLAWGFDPGGHHVVKTVLFAATAIMLFALVLRLTGLRAAAVVAGLVFALHPLNVSNAVWLATHANVLCAFFYLLALLLFIEARKRERGRLFYYIGFLAAMLLCFGAYELAYTLPVMVLLVELLFLSGNSGMPRKQYFAKAWRWHVPYLAIAAVFLALRLLYMGLISVATEKTSYNVPLGFWNMLMTLFMPVGRTESGMAFEIRSLPLIAGALLFAGALVFGKNLRLPAIFAALMLIIGGLLAVNGFNGILYFKDTRFLIIVMLGFSMLVGVYFSAVCRWRVGKAAAFVCILAILAVYAKLNADQTSRWSIVAAQSGTVLKTVSETCGGKPFPFRLVFITYPFVAEMPHYTEPLALVAALEAKFNVPVPPEFHLDSPYLKAGYNWELLTPEVVEYLRRWYPLWIGTGAVFHASPWNSNDRLPPIAGRDLQQTYFFWWDGTKLHDCTEQMRAHLALERKQELFVWTAYETFPYNNVEFLICVGNARNSQGVLYFAPMPNDKGALPTIRIDLHNLPSDEFDQVEITLSAASKSTREGYFTGRVAWRYKGEGETQEILDRAEPFVGRYYSRHEVENMPHYRIPLAHRFLQEGSREVESIYIILPLLPEYAVEDIRLSRFDE